MPDLLGTELHFDEADKTLTINRVQDVQAHIDYNKMLQRLEQKSDWGRHVAHIPNIFYEVWVREEWDRGNIDIKLYSIEFDEIVEKKLKDPDWKFLRTDSPESSYLGWSPPSLITPERRLITAESLYT
jgi:hypothetical protein